MLNTRKKINCFYKKAQRAFSNIILGGGGGEVILIIYSLKLLYIDTASHSTKPNLLNTPQMKPAERIYLLCVYFVNCMQQDFNSLLV